MKEHVNLENGSLFLLEPVAWDKMEMREQMKSICQAGCYNAPINVTLGEGTTVYDDNTCLRLRSTG